MEIKVLPYSKDNLISALSNKVTSKNILLNKFHLKYFLEYLGSTDDGLQAKTIVIEDQYTSRSYLLDYSNYYSTCFADYEKLCKRVHFFSTKINEEDFFNRIFNNDKDFLQESYLGFIVVKPLPLAKVGATILKTYANTTTGRHFPATKRYEINLLGVSLYIDSLAFIEQDKVVGACASSALWSTFQKTSSLFQTSLPSPSDITKSAKNLFLKSGRIFPNEGLDYYQIGKAIESVGLVSELRNSKALKDNKWLKSFIYAYNKIGLPVLLGIEIQGVGLHLISIVGYREAATTPLTKIGKKDVAKTPKKEISIKANDITRFYAHDDQIGPFSRIGFSTDKKFEIETSWVDKITGEKINAAVHSVIVPLSHKIRITFEDIYTRIMFIDAVLYLIITSHEIVWDIYLDLSTNYKRDVLNSSVDNKYKRKVSCQNYPKYVWLAKAYVGTECICEFIFDSTDIATGDYCKTVNIYNDTLKSKIAETLSDAAARLELEDIITPQICSLINEETV